MFGRQTLKAIDKFIHKHDRFAKNRIIVEVGEWIPSLKFKPPRDKSSQVLRNLIRVRHEANNGFTMQLKEELIEIALGIDGKTFSYFATDSREPHIYQVQRSQALIKNETAFLYQLRKDVIPHFSAYAQLLSLATLNGLTMQLMNRLVAQIASGESKYEHLTNLSDIYSIVHRHNLLSEEVKNLLDNAQDLSSLASIVRNRSFDPTKEQLHFLLHQPDLADLFDNGRHCFTAKEWKIALREANPATTLAIIKTLPGKDEVFLRQFLDSPHGPALANLYVHLRDNELFDGNDGRRWKDVLNHPNPEKLFEAIDNIEDDDDFADQDIEIDELTFDCLLECNDPVAFARILTAYDWDSFSHEEMRSIVKHPHLDELCFALKNYELGNYKSLVVSASKPRVMARIIHDLHCPDKAKQTRVELTPQRITRLQNYFNGASDVNKLSDALYRIAYILNDDIFDALLKTDKPTELANAIASLEFPGRPKYLATLLPHPNPVEYARAVNYIYKMIDLSDQEKELFAKHKDPVRLARALFLQPDLRSELLRDPIPLETVTQLTQQKNDEVFAKAKAKMPVFEKEPTATPTVDLR